MEAGTVTIDSPDENLDCFFLELFSFFQKKDLHLSDACASIVGHSRVRYAPVAQLDRVTGYEPVGRGFESLPAYQEKKSRIPLQIKGFRLFSVSFFTHSERSKIDV